jgi:uncharacterized protein YjbI with pentapeptide repeats
MPLDFSGQTLCGRSFQQRNLTQANFTHADIRSVDFTGANLVGAAFSHSVAGLSPRWRWIWLTLLTSLTLISGVGTGVTGAFIARLLTPSYIQDHTAIPGIISFAIVLIFAIALVRTGFTANLAIVTGIVMVSATLLATFLSPLFGFQGLLIADQIGSKLLELAAWGLGSLMIGILAMTTGWMIEKSSRFWLWGVWVLSLFINLYLLRAWATTLGWTNVLALLGQSGTPPFIAWVAVGSIAALEGCLCGYASQQARLGHCKFVVFRHIATFLAATGGTRFQNADLTDTTFTGATLNNTDFRGAILMRTNFHLAKRLDQARTGHTLLANPIVCELLVTHRGDRRFYGGCDLKGAYLAGASLNDADLTEADVSEAIFEGASLERANLTKVQAVKTNLRRSQLTGACLEAWNIASTTQLQAIVCDHVYLLNHHQERRPSSGSFAAGEFEKLFQEILNTVDLIFRDGLDFSAFMAAFKQVQIHHENTELTIRSIENKKDGVIVVKVEVPVETNKAVLHSELIQHYELEIKTLKARYEAELASKAEQIVLYRQHQEDLKELTRLLAQRSPIASSSTSPIHKLVVLKFGQGDRQNPFPVTLQVGLDGMPPMMEATGRLPFPEELLERYKAWQFLYRSQPELVRLDIPEAQVVNISRQEFCQNCHILAVQVKQALDQWLNDPSFYPLKEKLLEQLAPSELIRFVVQIGDSELRRLPLQLWEFFDRYPKAELALSAPAYQRVETVAAPSAPVPIRILAILGDSTGINVQRDRALLAQLPHAEVNFLVEPPRQVLNDHLWEQHWDILFFAGHSSSQQPLTSDQFCDIEIGQLSINPTDRLTIPHLKHALRKAIAQGLKLAIFNSCDGLGLAANLADLYLPQMIVMREPIPDRVAQEFLKNFLSAFSTGETLYQSVRDAREKLQGLEDVFPCASWLPVIFQNPAEMPLTWRSVER